MKQQSPNQDSINTYRSLIEGKSKNIDSRLAEDNIDAILRSRTKINDNIVIEIAKNFFSNNEKYISIIAVGGYGREELYPKSDTDLLILIEQKKKQSLKRSIKSFLAFLWDIGIEVSHSTRTLNECLKEGKKDLSIATSLIESRYLFGSKDLFINLEKKIFAINEIEDLEDHKNLTKEQITVFKDSWALKMARVDLEISIRFSG